MSESESKELSSCSPSTERRRQDSECGDPSSPEIHFEPIVHLPLIIIKTMEENEEEMLKLRAKLYRYDTSESVAEFKERGTGEVKILRDTSKATARILMRRDKTLKLCANHYILPAMDLKKHNNSEKVFVWSTLADCSDEAPKPETLAIRFGSVENAQKFKDIFDEAKKFVKTDDESELTRNLNKVNINKDDEDDDSESTDSEDEGSDNRTEKQTNENGSESKAND